MKKIILIEHAFYDRSTGHLVPQAEESLKFLSEKFNAYAINPDMIATSQEVRAIETADILAENLNWNDVMRQETAHLSEYADTRFVDFYLAKGKINNDAQTLICVSHMPTIMSLTRHWNRKSINLYYAEAAILDFESDDWQNLGRASSVLELKN